MNALIFELHSTTWLRLKEVIKASQNALILVFETALVNEIDPFPKRLQTDTIAEGSYVLRDDFMPMFCHRPAVR
jgi:hypothetical protein